MATSTQRNFLSLRKRLDQLGYRQPLAVESLPLVERLFEDLVHTTESLRAARLELGQRHQQEGEVSDHIQPFKNENARLVQENKDLHLRLIKEKEENDNKLRGSKATQRRLEHQNADLRFLNTQYLSKIRGLEKDVRDRNGRIQKLQEKNLQAVIHTPGGREKPIAFRRQRMELGSTVPPSTAGAGKRPLFRTPDPYVADLLQVADRRIEELSGELEQCVTEKSTAERRMDSLCEQVESRDAEIARLGALLEGGRPTEVIIADGQRDTNEKLVAHLRVQLECMEQARQERDKEMEELCQQEIASRRRCEEAEAKNNTLCEELKHINALTSHLEREAGEVRSQREQVAKLVADREEELRGKAEEVGAAKQESQRLQVDLKCLRQLLESSEEDARRSTKLLKQLDQEKRHLEEQCRQLTESGMLRCKLGAA